MRLENYSFDGMGPVRCSKCGFTHELVFSGTDLDTIDDAIDEALLEDGWDVGDITHTASFFSAI